MIFYVGDYDFCKEINLNEFFNIVDSDLKDDDDDDDEIDDNIVKRR